MRAQQPHTATYAEFRTSFCSSAPAPPPPEAVLFDAAMRKNAAAPPPGATPFDNHVHMVLGWYDLAPPYAAGLAAVNDVANILRTHQNSLLAVLPGPPTQMATLLAQPAVGLVPAVLPAHAAAAAVDAAAAVLPALIPVAAAIPVPVPIQFLPAPGVPAGAAIAAPTYIDVKRRMVCMLGAIVDKLISKLDRNNWRPSTRALRNWNYFAAFGTVAYPAAWAPL